MQYRAVHKSEGRSVSCLLANRASALSKSSVFMKSTIAHPPINLPKIWQLRRIAIGQTTGTYKPWLTHLIKGNITTPLWPQQPCTGGTQANSLFRTDSDSPMPSVIVGRVSATSCLSSVASLTYLLSSSFLSLSSMRAVVGLGHP